MVGPSLSPDEKRLASLRLQAGFVTLIAVSAGLLAVRSGSGSLGTVVAVTGGIVGGLALLWFLRRSLSGTNPETRG